MNIMKIIRSVKMLLGTIPGIDRKLDEIRINQGVILSELMRQKKSRSITDFEYKIFSEWGEDGIIQHLINSVDIKNKTFIEFGVEDFSESNCRFLLMNNNWAGFVIDGSGENIKRLKGSHYYWRHQLVAIEAFITRENISGLLAKSGFEEDLGILSIDLDGNDYYVLDAITGFSPRILICEYNSVFGPARKIAVPYDPDFVRTDKHHSNLYWGASLPALTHIASRKGYSLVGTNTASCNAFFVRNDLIDERLDVLTVEAAYAPSHYRESRDREGNLTFVEGASRLDLIRGMPVFNVETNAMESL